MPTSSDSDLRYLKTSRQVTTGMTTSNEATSIQLHDQLETLLPTARSDNCQVVATFLDVRGFSSYAEIGDTSNVAAYLRSV